MATKYRVHQWFDFINVRPYGWGIQAKIEGKWLNCAESGKALIFDLEYDACAKRLELIEREGK